MLATRISDEAYTRIMEKCAGLGCSTYDYLKLLVETDTLDTKQTKEAEGNNKPSDQNVTPQEESVIGISQQTLEEINRLLEEQKTLMSTADEIESQQLALKRSIESLKKEYEEI